MARILRHLLFEADDFGLSPEVPRHVAGQILVERLVHGGEYAAHQQTSNQVLGANAQLFCQVFYADTFRDGDAPRDRQRLVGDCQPWRRNKTLHRPFFGPVVHNAVRGDAKVRLDARLVWRAFPEVVILAIRPFRDAAGNRCELHWWDADHGAGRRDGRMADANPAPPSGSSRTRALENWLAANNTALRTCSLHGPAGLTMELRTRLARSRARRRRSVDRTRSSLGSNHAPLRNNWLPGRRLRWCCG